MMIEEKLAKTRSAFLWTRLLSTPFYVLYTLLPYILYRDVGATLLQVTTVIILHPAVSLIAPYVSVWVLKRPDRLTSKLAWANLLKFFPFLFILLIDDVAYFTIASMIYLILGRGVMPAWMEILKLNIPGESRTKVFAYGQVFDYLGIAFFPLSFGWILDSYQGSWRYLFFVTALIGIFSTWFFYRIPRQTRQFKEEELSLKEAVFKPWKISWDLLKRRPDFARFQYGFMLGGAGLMVLQPAYPLFFYDTLHLSYKEMTLALAFCKGISYAAATPFWTKIFGKVDIFRFCTCVTFLAALFPLLLFLAKQDILFLWIAYITYGVMQGGSELSWHLSGPVFSPQNDSSAYSQTNILAQGVRGALMPYLGYLLCSFFGVYAAFITAIFLCLLATYTLNRSSIKAHLIQN